VNGLHHLLKKQWTSQEITQKLENQRKFAHLLVARVQQQAPSESLRRDEALQRVNEANRRHNQQNIRAALIEEKRKKKEASIRAAEKAKAEANGETEKKEEIPKINLYHEKKIGQWSKRKTDDEILAEIDMNIDVEI
jgi:hypothetical protein